MPSCLRWLAVLPCNFHFRSSMVISHVQQTHSSQLHQLRENSQAQWFQRKGKCKEVEPVAKVGLRGRAIILPKGCNRKLSLLDVFWQCQNSDATKMGSQVS